MEDTSKFAQSDLKGKIQIWLEEVRAPFFTAVLVPVSWLMQLKMLAKKRTNSNSSTPTK